LHVFRSLPRWAAVLGSIALTACAARTPASAPATARADGCKTRVIISFSPEMQYAPEDGFVKDLARAANVELAFVSAIAPNLYVFTVSTAESDTRCRDALERLRRDPRIRSVDVDERRKAHS
jgi:hypothetical protein